MIKCVYMIYNLKNGKCYIGSTKNFEKRYKTHLYQLRHNKHHCLYLQRAWNKYGENKFIFSILEYSSNLFEDELKWINRINPEYNLGSVGGGDNISNHPHLESIKNKQSIISKNRYIKMSDADKIQLSNKFKGDKNPNWQGGISKPLCKCGNIIQPKATQCHKCRMSNFSGPNNSFYGKKHSEETKKKISEYHKNNSKNAKPVEIDGILYKSLQDAATKLGVTSETIRYRIKTNKQGYKLI